MEPEKLEQEDGSRVAQTASNYEESLHGGGYWNRRGYLHGQMVSIQLYCAEQGYDVIFLYHIRPLHINAKVRLSRCPKINRVS